MYTHHPLRYQQKTLPPLIDERLCTSDGRADGSLDSILRVRRWRYWLLPGFNWL